MNDPRFLAQITKRYDRYASDKWYNCETAYFQQRLVDKFFGDDNDFEMSFGVWKTTDKTIITSQ